MIKTILKFLVILVVGILVYNYFYGTETEKATSKKIFQESKEVFVAVKDLLKSEKKKYDDGKYDDALDKIETAFLNLKEKAKVLNDSELLDKIAELDRERRRIQESLDETKKENIEFSERGKLDKDGNNNLLTKEQEEDFNKDIQDLIDKTRRTMDDLESE